MAIAEKLNYLQETKNQIKNAINEKGISVTDTDSFRSYANKIKEIQSGSGGIEEYFNTTISMPRECSYVFNRVMKKMPFNFDTNNITNMSSMFNSCQSLRELDLSSFNTSNVTNMSNMFISCQSLRELDLSSFNTSNVTNMTSMFSSCESLTELDLSSFNTSNVTNMSYMFRYCNNLRDIKGILDLRNVISATAMISNCPNLETIYIKNLNATLSINSCPLLSHESIMYLINNLTDLSGATSKKITMGNNLTKITDEEKAIAINKNWTLSQF